MTNGDRACVAGGWLDRFSSSQTQSDTPPQPRCSVSLQIKAFSPRSLHTHRKLNCSQRVDSQESALSNQSAPKHNTNRLLGRKGL